MRTKKSLNKNQNQKSLHRPPFSQSPNRVGSGPRGPPCSTTPAGAPPCGGAGVSASAGGAGGATDAASLSAGAGCRCAAGEDAVDAAGVPGVVVAVDDDGRRQARSRWVERRVDRIFGER
jgi:hypothetical protein